MVSSLPPEEGGAASPCAPVCKNADGANGRTVASPVRHMHPDMEELLQAAGTTPRRRPRKRAAPAAATAEVRGRALYNCAFEEEASAEAEDGGFAPPRLVWAKVWGHPWWPGQVFDPADASACALRERKKRRSDGDEILVACFGDRTFVWAEAEDLLPFRDGFPRLADIGGRSSSTSAFAPALDEALDEVERRVDAGLSCACDAASIKKQVIVNSGVRKGARGGAVDAAFARDALRGEAFVEYVRALAVAPESGAECLDLAIVGAQMKAFRRWRSAADPGHDDVANGAVVVAARASLGRARTPRKGRRSRGGDRGDAPAGERTPSMCARAAAAAAADKAFMRHVFPGEAVEEYASAMALTPPTAGAELHDLAVATTPQRKAFDECRSESPGGITKIAAANGNAAVESATPPRRVRLSACAVSCISSGDENDGDESWETESEDFEPSTEWELSWKDYVIVFQFFAIVLLVCRLMQ